MPATDMEALKSPLMGIFEKRRARKFFIYVQDYNESDPKTHEGMDLTRVTTRELIAYALNFLLSIWCSVSLVNLDAFSYNISSWSDFFCVPIVILIKMFN